jgi:hypothetical protein
MVMAICGFLAAKHGILSQTRALDGFKQKYDVNMLYVLATTTRQIGKIQRLIGSYKMSKYDYLAIAVFLVFVLVIMVKVILLLVTTV